MWKLVGMKKSGRVEILDIGWRHGFGVMYYTLDESRQMDALRPH
jgi:hypothetical protein